VDWPDDEIVWPDLSKRHVVVWRIEVTFPIKKRIHTELLNDEREELHLNKGASKNKGSREEGKIVGAKGQQVVGWWEWETITAACFEMTLTGMQRELDINIKI